ncbi:MAG: hypothetical protein E2O37_09135 [Proteobacteria bacterium]|nr:MAG: hypothetical protein E2O37_09135 [Pseudomonadota bacterium]
MNKFYAVFALCVFVVADDVRADVHKCADADGNIMYSQMPCESQNNANVNRAGFFSRSTEMECGYANQFALSTARRMRVGTNSSEAFNRHGGIDALSKGARGIINHVYSYWTDSDISVEQIAARTEDECQARTLGIVNCEALPPTYTESIGGCPASDAGFTKPSEQASPAVQTTPKNNVVTTQTERTQSRRTETNKFVEQCKKWYRDSIDHIDAKMQRDYTSEEGEFYRKELRELTQRLREC